MAWRASLAFNLHRPHCHRGSNTVICCHYSPSLISTEVCSRSSNWESHPNDGDGKRVDLNVGNAGVPSSSSVLFPPAEGSRVCAPPASQVCREQRQELVFQSWQLKSARYWRVTSSSWIFFFPQEANSGVYFRLQEQFIPIHFQQSLRAIQLAFVSLNACDDFASGELQENPQVGSETSVPLFPFLLVRRMDFSGCALCSLFLPWIHQRLIFLLHVAPSHSK